MSSDPRARDDPGARTPARRAVRSPPGSDEIITHARATRHPLGRGPRSAPSRSASNSSLRRSISSSVSRFALASRDAFAASSTRSDHRSRSSASSSGESVTDAGVFVVPVRLSERLLHPRAPRFVQLLNAIPDGAFALKSRHLLGARSRGVDRTVAFERRDGVGREQLLAPTQREEISVVSRGLRDDGEARGGFRRADAGEDLGEVKRRQRVLEMRGGDVLGRLVGGEDARAVDLLDGATKRGDAGVHGVLERGKGRRETRVNGHAGTRGGWGRHPRGCRERLRLR